METIQILSEPTIYTHFKFWIKAFSYGEYKQYSIVKELPQHIQEIDEADDYLSNIMGDLMNEYDWSQVNDFGVVMLAGGEIEADEDILIDGRDPVKARAKVQFKDQPKREYKKRVKKETIKTVSEPEIKSQVPFDYITVATNGRPSEDNYYGSAIDKTNSDRISAALTKAINGKKILFLENGTCLDERVGNFYQWTLDNKIDSFCLFNVTSIPIEFVISKIHEYDVISFQTTYTYDTTHKLVEYVSKLKEPKTIIEIEGTQERYYKPKGIKHDLFMLNSFSKKMAKWSFKLLDNNTPIWKRREFK